jgi:ATP-dependent exoDNAse (exonuclease V) alpha subunit
VIYSCTRKQQQQQQQLGTQLTHKLLPQKNRGKSIFVHRSYRLALATCTYNGPEAAIATLPAGRHLEAIDPRALRQTSGESPGGFKP